MNLQDISAIRLHNQQISTSRHKSLQAVTGYMGALQAQDYTMAKWALGIRMPGCTDDDITLALNKGKILRTHVLRPTWHFISAKDIYWMLALTAPHIKASMKFRDKELELTPEIYRKSNRIITGLLDGGRHHNRSIIAAALNEAGINTSENRLSHLLAGAELDGLICSGSLDNNKQTYALLEERVPVKKILPREEALATLAQRYFESHGPVTLEDFTWWSGLPAKDARLALEMIKKKFREEKIAERSYWFKAETQIPAGEWKRLFLLPAFDELIVSYKDRSAILVPENHKRAVSVNGIFRPIIMLDGKAAGLWKRIQDRKGIALETEYFDPQQKIPASALHKAAQMLEHFWGQPIIIKS